MSQEVRLALGSNLGDRAAYLESARCHIEGSILTEMCCSSIEETEPVGPPQGRYLNQIVRGNCDLDPPSLLQRCQSIEASLGRKRLEHWGPRTIDIDILTFGQLHWQEESLMIPHPRIEERIFVLEPWAQLEPGFVVPGLEKTIHQLLDQLQHRTLEETES